jgi:hypothetical protein
MPACRCDACEQGDLPCPCPEACLMPDAFDRVFARITWPRFGIFCGAIAMVGFALARYL